VELKSYINLVVFKSRLLLVVLLVVGVTILILFRFQDSQVSPPPEVTTSSRKYQPVGEVVLAARQAGLRKRMKSISLELGNLTVDEKSDVLSFVKSASLAECSELLSSLPINDFYRDVLYLVAERFANEDPEGALRWLSSLDVMEANAPAFTMCSKILGGDIRWLEQSLSFVENDRFRKEILQHGIPQIALSDWRGAVDLVLREDLGISAEERAEFLLTAVARMGRDSVVGLVEEMSGKGGDAEKIGGRFWESLLSIAASKDVNFTRDFLLSDQYSEAAKIGATANLVEKWASKNPVEALGWIQQGIEGPFKDQAIFGFVRGVWDQQPSNAISWAASIGDSDLRKKTVKDVIRRAGAERELFKDIISELSVDPDEREEYRKFLSIVN